MSKSLSVVIEITDENEVPTDILLSQSSITEGNSKQTVIGTFTTVDPDAIDNHTYSLAEGGNYFEITKDNLLISKVRFSYDVLAKEYPISVVAKDKGGKKYEKKFNISIINTSAVIAGINDTQFTKTLSLFPNPAHQYFTLSTTGKIQTFDKVQIINMLGVVVGKFENVRSEQRLGIENLRSGMYSVIVKVGDTIGVKSLVIE